MEEKEWFLYVVDHHEGPLSIIEIKDRVVRGDIKPTSYVWKDGYSDWIKMSEVSEFVAIFHEPTKTELKIKTSDATIDTHGTPTFLVHPKPDLTGVKHTDTVFCLKSKNCFSGPHSIETLISKIQAGEISKQDSVWKEGWTHFVSISFLPEFTEVTKSKKNRSKWKWFLIFMVPIVIVGVLRFPLSRWSPKVKILFQKTTLWLPSPLQSWIQSIKIPKNLAPSDVEILLQATNTDSNVSITAAAAKLIDEEANPIFIIASNAPDGTKLSIQLRGREGTLLNAFQYEKSVTVEIIKHTAQTPRFYFEENKALPKGEYILSIAALADSSTPISSVGFFLGGLKDSLYHTRLQEFNQRIHTKRLEIFTLMQQVFQTMEGLANESATNFYTLSKNVSLKQRKKEWEKYHKKYIGLSQQIKTLLDKVDPQANHIMPRFTKVHQLVRKTYDLTETLHQAQTKYFNQGGNLSLISQQASQTLESLKSLQQVMTETMN